MELENENPTLEEFVEKLEDAANVGIANWRDEGYWDEMVMKLIPVYGPWIRGTLFALRIESLDHLYQFYRRSDTGWP